jgi:glycosyltransferase involved in cell wall biosynthesis
MKNKLLIIAMSDLTLLNKAPARRMKAIIDNFEKMKVPISVLSGNRKQRSIRVRKFLFSNDLKNIKGVYVESSNSGMVFAEFLLLLILKVKKNPISVFIRDSYPLFREYWTLKYYRQTIANIFWLISYCCYHFLVDTMYFPSEILMRKFKFNNKKLLQPAIPNIDFELGRVKNNSMFYAGGIGQQYDIETFLTACKKLTNEKDISVTIFCREEEVNRISKWWNYSWLNIQHKNLEELDFQPMLGIIPLRKHFYSDLTFPVKLLDYVSINAVIIASDSTVTKEYIEKNKIGVVVKSGDSDDYYRKVKELLENEKYYNSLKENVVKLSNSEEVTWENRCQKVLDDFGFKHER